MPKRVPSAAPVDNQRFLTPFNSRGVVCLPHLAMAKALSLAKRYVGWIRRLDGQYGVWPEVFMLFTIIGLAYCELML